MQITIGTPLTKSGLGRVLEIVDADNARSDEIGRSAREVAAESGLALVRGLDLDEDAFKRLVHAVGETVTHKFGEGQADLLKLNASREEGKIITGRGGLPLHTDGLIVGEQVDFIILYAAEFADEPGSGETFVVDQLSAWAQAPSDIEDIVGEGKYLEYLVTDRGYFPSVPEDWYQISTVRDYGRVRSLNLALAFDENDTARSWDIRVPGLAESESKTALDKLARYLRSPEFSYQHVWKPGDLLIIDNQRTLHGRTAISDGGTRVLFRGQITIPS